jgi:hypothetical protein
MDHVAVRGMRIGAIAMFAVILICGICRQSAAEAGERNSNQPSETVARNQAPATGPAASSEQQAKLGAMRYYGGPKSPMWRGPAAN